MIATPESAAQLVHHRDQGERAAAAGFRVRPGDLGSPLDPLTYVQRLMEAHATTPEHAPRILQGREKIAGHDVAVAGERALQRSRTEQDHIPALGQLAAAPVGVRVMVQRRGHATHSAERDLVILPARPSNPAFD